MPLIPVRRSAICIIPNGHYLLREMDFLLIKQLGISLGLGLLVGLQREWGDSHVAGIRTFALITVFGTLSARLGDVFGGWIIAAGLIALSALLIAGGIAKFTTGDISPGLTTASAALLMYAVGAVSVIHMPAAIIMGGATAVLLHWKEPLHSMVRRFSEQDLRAIIQLVLISLVILPVLPNRFYGPFDVINPYHIWLIVVLIVGISVGGYIISIFMSPGKGAFMAGTLGGIISSTATTVSFSRQSKHSGDFVPRAAFIILIASTVVFLRVALEIGIISPHLLPRMLPQLAAMTALMAVACAAYYVIFITRLRSDAVIMAAAPSNLRAAVVFGLLYAVVLFTIAAVRSKFGEAGLYWVAGLSGLTDMDAITLSTAQLIQDQRIAFDTGWRMILIGALSNMVFKGAIAVFLGRQRLMRHLAVFFGFVILGGICIIVFWPKS